MPQKKKKYNARFPPGRIKKIMQTDEDVGKVAAAVPIMISRTLELFVESLLAKTMEITNERQARTLSPSHMKQCIMSESRFDFLRELVSEIPNINWAEDYPSQGEGPEPCTPVPAVPPANGNGPLMRQNSLTQPVDRPRRPYQRPVSYCELNDLQDNSTASSSVEQPAYHADESPTGILKRKLLDPSRKSASTDTPNRSYGASKLVRLDSSPAAFSESRKGVTRRRKSNEATNKLPSGPESNLATVNINPDALGAAMVQIIPDEHSSGCKVNVDFSKLISPALSADTSTFNGVNKLLLNPAAVEAKTAALSTPNLTTPTGLNYAPPFPVLSNTSPAAAFAPPPITTSSSLQMDEDYDDL